MGGRVVMAISGNVQEQYYERCYDHINSVCHAICVVMYV
jgi:hypothetical protein